MKISGFTIVRNAIQNDYPVAEAIASILPVVDEMIVSVGESEDGTERLLCSLPSDKIRIVRSVWDPAIRKGGAILAIETNKAFAQVSPESDWAFYIQADEAIHEQDHAAIRETAERYLPDRRVQGLLFRYLHFYGTYDYVGDSRRWYDREVRLIRNDKEIRSYKDAQGFRWREEKLRVKPVDACVYHYGWVKDPVQMKRKLYNAGKLWHSDEEMDEFLRSGEAFDFADFDSIARFTGTHPAAMAERIARRNWRLELDPRRKEMSVRNRLLHWYEKRTGRRLFSFRNYRLI